MPFRVDKGRLRRAERTDEGYLMVEGYATRAGIFLYRNDDGSIRRELRPKEEVAKADSLATLGRKPYTDRHPPEPVNPKNIQTYGAGTVGENIIWEDEGMGGFVRVTAIVTRDDAIKSIESGRRELSCGYFCDVDNTSGVHGEWGEYDTIQRNIRYNHLAGVDRGRAGAACKIHVDEDDIAFQVDTVLGFSDLPLASREHPWRMVEAVGRLKRFSGAAASPNDEFAKAFLWFDLDAPDDFDSYRLPIADVVAGELRVVPRAIFDAASKLQGGGRGSVPVPEEDLDFVRAHLEQYYRKMRRVFDDFDRKAPWLRGDSNMIQSPLTQKLRSDAAMKVQITIDGVTYEVEESVARAIKKERTDAALKIEDAEKKTADEKARADNAEGERDKLKKDRSTIEAERDNLKTKVDELEEKRTDGADIDIASRLELLSVAKKLKVDGLGDDPVQCKLSNAGLKKKIVSKRYEKDSSFKVDEKDEVYIEASYDAIRRDFAERKDHLENLTTALNRSDESDKRTDEDGSAVDEAAKAYDSRADSAFFGSEDAS